MLSSVFITRSITDFSGSKKKIFGLGSFLLVLGVFTFCASHFEKLIIYNLTPSVPEGFYHYAGQDIDIGKVMLFEVPKAVKDYTNTYYATQPLEYFLKPVAARGGDHVCYKEGAFLLNDNVFANVKFTDRHGNPLPLWRECRTLKQDEVFVYSDRAENSFDSRYYGPIKKDKIIGIFRKM